MGDDENSVLSHDQEESSVCDGEDAVILTARRVKIVRCCQAKQTTLSAVRIWFEMSHGAQLIDSNKGVATGGPKE